MQPRLINQTHILVINQLRVPGLCIAKNHISDIHLGFGKYGGPNEHLLCRPQKINILCDVLQLVQFSCL